MLPLCTITPTLLQYFQDTSYIVCKKFNNGGSVTGICRLLWWLLFKLVLYFFEEEFEYLLGRVCFFIFFLFMTQSKLLTRPVIESNKLLYCYLRLIDSESLYYRLQWVWFIIKRNDEKDGSVRLLTLLNILEEPSSAHPGPKYWSQSHLFYLKELQEPNKRLAENTSNRQPAEKELDDDFDPEK